MPDNSSAGRWFSALPAWIGVIGALVGGYFGLGTYALDVEKKADARVVQTFDLYELFSSEAYVESRNRVLDSIYRGEDASDNDIYLFVDFFDVVQICVERDLCEEQLVEELFRPYAAGSYDGLSEFINFVRRSEGQFELSREFGAGMEWLANGRSDPPATAAPNDQADQ